MEISFSLNGEPVSVAVEASERLLDTLRYRLGFTGTKEGCGEGECGACTVMFDGLPANSCLIPTYQARGHVIETIESVSPDALDALHRSGATQCGACSPGVVMTALWVNRNPDVIATHSIRELMAGNLCRCTGYDGIVDGLQAWVDERADTGDAAPETSTESPAAGGMERAPPSDTEPRDGAS